MFEIDVDIPIPPVAGRPGRGREPIYPFGSLEFGMSFFVSDEAAPKARDAAKHYRNRHPGWNYHVAKEGDGIRIWRTA